jgi:hypothetical protein
MNRIAYVVAIAALSIVTIGSFTRSPDTVALTPTTVYKPTTGFEYFPAQYKNQATIVEAHAENF